MTERILLKECPFCGHKGIMYHTGYISLSGIADIFAVCNGCGAQTCVANSEEEALKEWNTRAPADLHAENTALRQEASGYAAINDVLARENTALKEQYEDAKKTNVAVNAEIMELRRVIGQTMTKLERAKEALRETTAALAAFMNCVEQAGVIPVVMDKMDELYGNEFNGVGVRAKEALAAIEEGA